MNLSNRIALVHLVILNIFLKPKVSDCAENIDDLKKNIMAWAQENFQPIVVRSSTSVEAFNLRNFSRYLNGYINLKYYKSKFEQFQRFLDNLNK